jgi:hypothetical protein
MVEVHAELIRVLTQNLINSDSKELPPGMQQVLDNHSQMVQMMPRILARINNNTLPQNNHGSKEPRDGIEITPPSAAPYEKKKTPQGETNVETVISQRLGKIEG